MWENHSSKATRELLPQRMEAFVWSTLLPSPPPPQVPQYILDSILESGQGASCNIVVTQVGKGVGEGVSLRGGGGGES